MTMVVMFRFLLRPSYECTSLTCGLSSKIDVVQFQVPHTCDNEEYGCGKEWSQLGVGKLWNRSDVDGTQQEIIQWCCSVEAVQNGICHPTQQGRLIVRNKNNYNDEESTSKLFHRSLEIPNRGRFQKRLTDATLTNRSKGRYAYYGFWGDG